MSGFEELPSRLSGLLHPRIDAADTYDPTFLGVTRKRRGIVPVSEFLKDGRGKRIMAEHRLHTDVLTQMPEQHVPETFKGDVTATRFGLGFSRRSRETIGSDIDRRQQDKKNEVAAQARLEVRREHFYERTRSHPMNPITGVTPKALKDSIVAPQLEGHRKGKGAAPHKSHSQIVFNWTDASARLQQQLADVPAAGSPRRDRLLREGRMEPRDWSVAQQMRCMDGFVLPTISR